MPGAKLAQSPEEGVVCITEALITKRNLAFPEDECLSEKIDQRSGTLLHHPADHSPRFHTLAELQTIRLDREGITTIGNLEGLQNLHSLYLQANKIQRIENLACIPSLRFLSLAGNQIRQVENLRDLPHLQFLDLSENLIETLKLDEFPQSLLILNLIGNSYTKQDGYRELVTEALPLLLDLDGQPILERWASDEVDQASGSEDDEFPELSGPFCSERETTQRMAHLLRSHLASWLLSGQEAGSPCGTGHLTVGTSHCTYGVPLSASSRGPKPMILILPRVATYCAKHDLSCTHTHS
nr:leucine-rich repeat-containing protein 46 isoform X3 [Manis javanica]